MSAPDRSTPAGVVLRSEGQRMLLAVTGSLTAIATEVGMKSHVTVHEWKTGDKLPSVAARARMQQVFGIPQRAWSMRPGGTLDSGTPADTPTNGAASPSTLDDCLSLLAVIRRDRNETGLLPSERVKLATAETQILALRARLEQAAELAESRYVTQHPAWLRLRRAILVAIEPYPDAAQAVADAITKLEGT